MRRADTIKRRDLLRTLPASAALACLLPSCSSGDQAIDLLAAGDLSDWVEEFHPRHREQAAAENWSTFRLEDGVLRVDGSRGNIGFLRHTVSFCDFDLSFEARADKGCNNGICFRAPVYENQTPAHTGYELQLLWVDANNPIQATGSLYSVNPPVTPVSLPVNEWISVRVRAEGTRVQGWINDVLVQDYDQNSSEDTRDRPRCGYFFVQNHGGDTEFRNMRVHVLSD